VWRKVSEHDLPLSLSLGVLGLNGLTAYFGLLDVLRPVAGETVVVSTAAGSVGSAVGQIAKIKGCRTVGVAGGADKVRLCVDEFGYDAAIDYKGSEDLTSALAASCPDGIDAFFDNTSGAIHDTVLGLINLHARIAICGTASYPRWEPWNHGPRPERHLLVKRATMQGFLTADYAPRFDEAIGDLAGWIRDGRLTYREDVYEGIETAPGSIDDLYSGHNTGKLVIRVLLRAQTSRPMPPAATRSAPSSRCRSRLRVDTTAPMAATTEPSDGRVTGTASEQAPSVISSAVVATPSRRMRSNCEARSGGCVMVCAVTRVNPANTRSRTSAGACASSTLPTPVACMGNRLPTELTIGTDARPRTVCRYSTWSPSRTARCTVAIVAA
jgi:hypothetical protein